MIGINRPRFLTLGVMILSIAFFSIGCKKNIKQAPAAADQAAADQLVGVWQNREFVQTPTLTINKNGTYTLFFPRSNFNFNGNYHISDDLIHVVDFYCGKAVPGIYKFIIKGNILSFQCVDDPACDRNKFFIQKWNRQK